MMSDENVKGKMEVKQPSGLHFGSIFVKSSSNQTCATATE